MIKTKRIAAVIPAHNEQDSIETIVRSICTQTMRVEKIVVVNDGSTDRTQEIIDRLAKEIPELVPVRNTVPAFRAGAVNAGFEHAKDCDYVLVVDADSIVDPHAIEEGVKILESDPDCGGVCSIAGVLDQPGGPIEKRYMQATQRLEYGGFNAERTATWDDVMILHGLCTMFRVSAVLEAGGYSSGHLLEDYDLTLKLKENGWTARYNPEMKAFTKTPDTVRKFIRQRIRWYRGGIDILAGHGITRHTRTDFVQHVMFISLFAVLTALVAERAVTGGLGIPSVTMNPVPVGLAVTGYVFNLYRVKFVPGYTAKDIIIKAAVVPELVMAMLQSGILIYAYAPFITGKSRSW